MTNYSNDSSRKTIKKVKKTNKTKKKESTPNVDGCNIHIGTSRINDVLIPKYSPRMMVDLSVGAPPPSYAAYLERINKGGNKKFSMTTWRRSKKRVSKKRRYSMSTWRRSKKRRLLGGKTKKKFVVNPGKIPD